MSKNARTVINILMMIVGMTMLVIASPSLYRTFCEVTGLDGTPQKAEKPSDKVVNRTIEVFFDANVDPRLEWEFKPAVNKVNVQVGENKLAFYKAVNHSNKPVTGRSAYNVSPEKAAIYFNKVECFCFINQTIKPGETIQFPLSFFIDPAFADDPMMDDVETITLSYTFYLVEDK